MAVVYTVFWTQARCDALWRLGGVGKPLHTLFGGPHTSEPSFRRATVRPGDDLYPIAVRAGTLYVLGRVRVKRILTLEEYVAGRSDLFAPFLREPPAWVVERGGSSLTPQYVQALEAFDRLREAQPEYRYLAPTCTEEAVECEDGAPTRLDLTVPPDMLARLRYRSRRAERDLSKYIRDGRLTSVLGVQGIYRLSEASQRELEALVASEMSATA
ncbi:MAG TPA: hypothetical protein VFQ25_15095 [Ktedonobacterales bacterium]|nr:hypothetical protein [Ktedonobacterales bacterium]